jgi:peptide/nickel transport system substrate-binding protein
MKSEVTTDSNWWDSFGKPQYGGQMIIRASRNIVNFDPFSNGALTTIQTAWMEKLHADDWTLDPAVFDYKTCWRPSQYLKGQLAESWEFTDPSTCVVHLRKGIHWQDIPPANGREFIADDVIFHFNRLCGLGGGFTRPTPDSATFLMFKNLISLTATDKYTVVFRWKIPNPEFIMENLFGISLALSLENPDAVNQWGDLSDWRHAIGTGPFILKDFVSNSFATLIKNPNYWGYDERYPQNKLPYIEKVKYVIIPENTAALVAMSAGKIDIIDGISPLQAQTMRRTNPEILQKITPLPPTFSVCPRVDKAPFNDIRVRKAMQMAIDLPTIAKDYYQGLVEPYPDTLTSRYVSRHMKGWGFPYEEWPQDLKDEYAYNPTASKKLLADAGYPNGFKTNIVVASDADMDLLQIVKSFFAQVGIDMEIRPMEASEWVSFVQIYHKHDQLSHTPAGALGHTAPPLIQLMWLQTGSRKNQMQMISDPVCDNFYTKALTANSLDEVRHILKDANEYVARQHFAISLLQAMSYSLCQPWLKGFDAQFGSTWGVAAGPLMLSHYLARFWIDQNLKESMRH